ncbi:tudor domain-containing protein 6 [Talpa occidentalis]|uniref:tudor domain-containing protein 6 n=1 Tax=Talpa occidentalis TaxID=50954 RepID=UPI00188E2AB9|nr:tudor domain-containing protein 6 [Talpa occidentalis]
MCSTPSLPAPGASLALRVSFVDVHPEVIPVQLWGLVGERREEYVRLSLEIQEAAATRGPWALGGASASPGELCLVQVGLMWHRCRVVSRQAQESRVFLLDEGRTITAGAGSLAPGRGEFFHLPSEVLGCVLAGLVPAGGGEPQHWPSSAVDFLSSLQGKEVHGRVLDVLLLHRLVLLEVPSLFQQMQELGLARQVPDSLFRSLLKRSLETTTAGLGPGTPVLPRVPPKQEPPSLDFFYPQLQLGVTEPVVVTQVCHPHRIHCQLRSLSQEIRRLSESMAQVYRASTRTSDDSLAGATWEEREESPDKPGSPCASCGLDGHWYRALLLETFRPQRCAQVLHVDYGRKELVSCSSLRYLLPEYFRMPVVTYPCALYGLWDGGRGWSRSQVGDLKALILGQAVNAKIEFYCSFEHVYYVTLYGEDGINLNCVFGVQSCCLADRFLQSQGIEEEEEEEEPDTALQSQSPAEEVYEEISLPALRSIRLKMNAFYDAQVEFVKSPSEFWIRLRKHNGTFSKLMRRMCSFYSSASKLDGVVLKPEPDDLCCVKWKENGYFRAIVTRLDDRSVDVFLVDRGNSENVDWYDVRMLLPQFRRLPILALRCTLADIWPLGKIWSQEAITFFKKTVLHKELVIHVLDKQDNQFVIEILDESRTGEENISKVIAQAGYAKYQEFDTKENVPLIPHSHSPGSASNQFTSDNNKVASAKKVEVEQKVKRENKTTSVSEALTDTTAVTNVSAGLAMQEKEKRALVYSPLVQNFLEVKPGSSKEELEVGSTVEVRVSYVESPSCFWCQLAKNMPGFRTLMSNIQDYCMHTATPYQGTTPACLAKRTVNEKWSRALIVGPQSSEHVQVTFVDYGDKDKVSVKDIYSISEEFLTVKAQAFRCSLYNLIQPTGQDPLVWDEKAIKAFNEFIDNAKGSNLQLKCTIFALASIHGEELFNIVDLLTPFQSVCYLLVEKRLARPVKLQKPLESSVQLRSYYYSTHDMKIGSEESVYITHIDDPWTFYCQLGRNAHILGQLSCSIAQLSKVLLNLQNSTLIPGNLCLAKYTDGNWYRGTIIEKEPNNIFFVDFGNIYVVTNDDLLPIPSDAYDVLLLPMQAVKCSLSDIPDHIPEEITAWFKETVLDKSLKALVVAKDPDGRLIIELYDDSVQINANINEKLELLGYKSETRKKEESKVLQSTTDILEIKRENIKLSPTKYLSKSVGNKLHSMAVLEELHSPKIRSACKELKLLQSSTKADLHSQYKDSVENKNNQLFPLAVKKEGFAELPLKATKLEATLAERKVGDIHNTDLPLNFSKFPQKTIVPGFKATVYVSHINDLSDFYVQLTEDEAEINHLSERLNDVRTKPEYYTGPALQKGDVICATFPDDNLWYRAVIKEQQSNDLLSVQFIDYGNVSIIHTNKIGKLDLINAQLPGLAIHCSLRGLWAPEILNSKEIMHYFSRRTDEAQIRCEFVKFQDRWEVILTDEHGVIAEDMINTYASSETSQVGLSTHISQGSSSKPANKTDLDTSVFLHWYNPKMKMVRAYATVIDGPEYFWCQFADTEKLHYLEAQVQTAGEQVTDLRSHISCPRIGDPCIVRYREDGHYYRALITNICEDYLVSVRLVDFGNVEDCVDPKALWNIPPGLLVVPMQAFPCCLSGFNISEGACPQEGNDYFYEIVTEDVLEITILEVKRDVCDIPLAIVDLKSKGESINEKMKKYSKMANSGLLYEKSPTLMGSPSHDVGLKKPITKAGHEKTLYVEPETDELSERIRKDLNMIETKLSKLYDPDADNIFEVFENPCMDKIGTQVLEGKMECQLVDNTKFDDENLLTGFNTRLPHMSETKEILELNSLELPLSPDDESKEFLELESIELQHSLVGDEEKQELSLVPPPQDCDTEAALRPFTVPLPLSCEAEKQPQLELPTAPLCLEDKVSCLSLQVNQKDQESMGTEDPRKASCVECFDDQHRLPLHLHGKNCDTKMHVEMNIYKQVLTDYKPRDVMSSLTSLFPEEESREGRKTDNALPDRVSVTAQPENIYILKGFTVGSKCVVWSSLRNTWSKCEILEIAEEGTRVLNLSDGMEEIVKPENVWNGIPKLDKSPSEAIFQTMEKDLYFMSSDDTAIKEKESEVDTAIPVDPEVTSQLGAALKQVASYPDQESEKIENI